MPDKRPSVPAPEPLRGSEVGTFTHHSVANRLPEIGRRMLAENTFSSQVESRISALLDGIPEAGIRHLTDDMAPDAPDWAKYIEPYKDQNWLQIPWFFAETYFYRRIMEATGYFGEGSGRGTDPFVYQKDEALTSSQEAIKVLCARFEEIVSTGALTSQALENLVRIDLWSNQADLSLWPVGSELDPAHEDEEQQQAHILVDETAKVAEYLLKISHPAKRVDFLVDNAGFELVVDLNLAVFLLQLGIADIVRLNLKAHPTFVSDATNVDVRKTIGILASSEDRATAATGVRLRRYLEEGRIQLRQNFFWTSPLAMWEMPDELWQDLAQSALIISKGDANYRRLLGDRHWPFTTPFTDIVAYLPVPLVGLRALKSEVACGLLPDQPASIASQDPSWLTNGRWGVIQFYK